MPISNERPLVGIVGPCTAGKSTLHNNLAGLGISSRHIAQEHSYVPDMWKRLTNPIFLVFLDVSYQESFKRKNLNWTPAEYAEQQRRLAHALAHSDLYMLTDFMSIIEVRDTVISSLSERGLLNHSV